jgi:hypothetical protein
MPSTSSFLLIISEVSLTDAGLTSVSVSLTKIRRKTELTRQSDDSFRNLILEERHIRSCLSATQSLHDVYTGLESRGLADVVDCASKLFAGGLDHLDELFCDVGVVVVEDGAGADGPYERVVLARGGGDDGYSRSDGHLDCTASGARRAAPDEDDFVGGGRGGLRVRKWKREAIGRVEAHGGGGQAEREDRASGEGDVGRKFGDDV